MDYTQKKNLCLIDPMLYWHPRSVCNFVIWHGWSQTLPKIILRCAMQTWRVLSLLLTWPYGMCTNPWAIYWWCVSWHLAWELMTLSLQVQGQLHSQLNCSHPERHWQSQEGDMFHWVWFSAHVLLSRIGTSSWLCFVFLILFSSPIIKQLSRTERILFSFLNSLFPLS